MSPNIELQLVNSMKQFESLQDDWNNLYEQSEKSTIFSSWDWMYTWWEVFHDQFTRQLFVLCLYQDEKLVGIAPFQIDKSYPKALIQGKTLRFIGAGEAYEDSIVSQFQDFIVLPEIETEFIKLVSEYLIENKKKWNFADFEFLLEDALVLKCFKSVDNHISRTVCDYGVRFFIPEADSFEDYQSKMGKRWKKMFTKKSRIMSRDGAVSISEINTQASINPALKQLAKMHCSRWKDRVDCCIFDSARFYNFHQKILHRLVPQGKASIKTLMMGDEALASYYIFEDKKQVHYYQSGFYSKFANRYSPLFLLVCNEIGSAIEANKTFDFMYDDSVQSYKKEQYAASYTKMYRLKWATQPFRFFVFDCAIKARMNYSSLYEKIKNKLKVFSKNKGKK